MRIDIQGPQPRSFRPEIQGVRAIAVIAVLVFHLWPSVLPGGYVGVDVFFVVSGFLITGLLLRQAERTGTIDLVNFYAKRIKRLLPAATLVLVAVGTCVSLLPILRWDDTANEIAASALYFENWWLAAKAVDYLAAEVPPSPLQHFWSLSVEEQYYLIWPLLFLLTGSLGAIRANHRKRFGFVIVAIGVTSFAYSVYITPRNPGLAYFATTTRAWELALGGLLATYPRWERFPEGVRRALGVLGLALVCWSAYKFNADTVFPGYSAALPTVGAALLIMSGESARSWSVYSVLNSRPLQYIGDLSYSLYLWHWPVVIFYREISGRELGLIDGVVVAFVSIALAHQTKVLVEDVFRRPAFASSRRWQPFAFAAGCVALPVLCWAAIQFQIQRHSDAAAAAPNAVSIAAHPGALARTDGMSAPSASIIPDALSARQDRGDPYKDGCISGLVSEDVRECVYGASDAPRHIVIVGDSHAVHWVPTLQVLAEVDDVRVTAITKSACAMVTTPYHGDLEQYRTCAVWSAKVLARLKELVPDAVLFAQSRNSLSKIRATRDESAVVIADSLVQTWNELDALGIAVFAIADTPTFGEDVPDCLASQGGSVERCSRGRDQALPDNDSLVKAAHRHGGVRLLDYSDVFCSAHTCEPVIGNVLAWRDAHHMTATFARTLAPVLSRDLDPVVDELSGEDIWAVFGAGVPPLQSARQDASGLSANQCTSVQACEGRFRPSLAAVARDVPDAYERKCHLSHRDDRPRGCALGSAGGRTKLMVVGDSHAAQWLPAFDRLGQEHNVEVESHTKSACAFGGVLVVGGVLREGEYTECRDWGQRLLEHIRLQEPDYVVISQSVAYTVVGLDREESFDHLVRGYTEYISEIERGTSTRVVVLADTPRLGFNVPECLAAPGATFAACGRNASEVLARPDPLVAAAQKTGAEVISLNHLVCPEGICAPVKDGILVWRDSHHVTATFADYAAEALAAELDLVGT